MFTGAKEYQKWKEGEPFGARAYKKAVLAHCYQCNGENEGGVDCLGAKSCPLYQFMPYRGKRAKNGL
jgi:hypothetical protein